MTDETEETNGGAEPAAEGAAETSLAEQLEKSQKAHAEAQDRLLRVAAEFENYKKRSRKELDDAGLRGQEQLLRELFPVLDNLERALNHAPKDNPLTVGVQLVEKQLIAALEKIGVTRFSAIGQPFDPAQQDAISHVVTDEFPPGTVAQEFAKGFRSANRLLRPAMVAVAKAPAAPSEGDGSSGSNSNGEGSDEATKP